MKTDFMRDSNITPPCFAGFAGGSYNRGMDRVALPISRTPGEAAPWDQSVTGPRDIRAVRTMRISVTDRCNFRCVYCMPEDKMDWVQRDRILSFEEILAIAEAAAGLGITSFKITGGEPLVRQGVPDLVRMLAALPCDPELSMTTNGALLVRDAAALRDAGLHRLTVSLDTLDPDRFRAITRGANIDQVWAGIRAVVGPFWHD